MRKLIGVLVLLLVSLPVQAASRDYAFSWEHSLETIDGDTLDPNGDGIPELLAGYRVWYEPTRALITDIPDSSISQFNTRLNFPFGNNCFYATAYMFTDTTGDGVLEELESADSNIECKWSAPGNPNAPVKNPITDTDRGIDRFLLAYDARGSGFVVAGTGHSRRWQL